MPRPAAPPAFPDSPGKWLAWFRTRRQVPESRGLTPGAAGKLLNVSEATMRRWEADLSRPRFDDLVRLSGLYGLSPLEEQFLMTACTAVSYELPPAHDVFIKEATAALSIELPAALLDSLFYLRAWNSYAEAFQRPEGVLNPNVHTLVWSLSPNQVELWDETREAIDHKGWRRVQEFWLLSAGLCGTDAYRELVAELRDSSPLFRERWLASEHTPQDLTRPIGTMSQAYDEREMFRRVPLTIHMPPAYHLRLYVPNTEQAEAALKRVKRRGGPTVFFNEHIHWASGSDA